MAHKRRTEEPDPSAKRATQHARILSSIDDYRLVLGGLGQTLAAQLLGDGDSHMDIADKWLRDAAPTAVASCILSLCADYILHRAIVDALLTSMPAVWTMPVDNVPFVICLYGLKVATTGELEPLFLSITDAATIECQHPETGDTPLHYAVENMHVAVVHHFLLNLRCNMIANKVGQHALFSALLMGNVEAGPTERIIRILHHARQRNHQLYDPNQVVADTTILGLLAKYPYPSLLHAWTDSFVCNGMISSGARLIDPLMRERLAESAPKLLKACILANDVARMNTLLENGIQISGFCSASEHTASHLMCSVTCPTAEIPALLIAHGAYITKSCSCGANVRTSPLAFAAYLKRHDTVRLLLSRDASIEEGHSFVSPICFMMHDPAMRPLVIERLPSINMNQRYRRWHCVAAEYDTSLLALAVETGDQDLVRAFIAAGANDGSLLDESLLAALETDNFSMFELILSHFPPAELLVYRRAATHSEKFFDLLFAHINRNIGLARQVFQADGCAFKCPSCNSRTCFTDLTQRREQFYSGVVNSYLGASSASAP